MKRNLHIALLRAALFALCALGPLGPLGAGGTARADEPPSHRVRSTATVEVIDDARHVDDIISRMKAAHDGERRAVTPGTPATAITPGIPGGTGDRGTPAHHETSPVTTDRPQGPAPRAEPHKIDRPALPSALPDEAHGAARPTERDHNAAQSHHDRRTERDRKEKVDHHQRRR